MLTQAVNQLSSIKMAQISSKRNADVTVSFDSIISQNLNQTKEGTSKNTKTVSSDKNTNEKRGIKEDISSDEKMKQLATQDSTKDTTENVKQRNTDLNANDVEEEKDIPEELEEAMQSLQEIIQTVVMKILGISKEECDKYMEELSMQPLDLLKSTNSVMQLIMKAGNADEPIKLLTDENLSNQFTQLTEFLNECKDTEEGSILAEMGFFEEVKNLQDEDAIGTMVESKEGIQDSKTTKQENLQIVVEKSTLNSTKDTAEMVSQEDLSKDDTNKLSMKENSFRDERKEQEGDLKKESSQAETFIENLAIKGQNSMDTEAMSKRVDTMRMIVDQVVEQIKVQIKPETTSMDLQLNPQNLGKINISVALKDGQLTATITTQTQITKEAIEGQIQVLKDNLTNQGLKVEAVEVMVSNFQFSFNQDNQTGNSQNQQKRQNGQRRIDLAKFKEDAEGVTEEEILASEVMKQNGGSVDYTA